MESATPEIERLTGAVTPWPDRARALVVEDQDGYERAAVLLREIKGLRSEIADTFGPIVAKALAAHREALAQRKRHEAPLELAERTIKTLMAGYVREEERKAREEAARLEREAREEEARRQAAEREAEEQTRLAEAEELYAAGKNEEAMAVLDAPMPEPDPLPPPPPVVVTPPPRAAGISVRETWSAEVTDLVALVRAVADGKAPAAFLRADLPAINGWARATKGSAQVPGVRVRRETGVAARAS